ncbi:MULTISPECIES: sugar porter family MFS transporter [Rhodococcus]|uniref:Sugar porter family MFS transporter n=1 Tax=Rhodococcus oxybenzonivorans TaxID=1990687 RepID=A0AAE5A5W1_9NOCA|nr:MULTISPECIES: sugar porter family MFS transporter [Rhodococcus]MDV7244999.1 sugar porter family MFS transporter [Rhodococcus oxybenzonivorans]MDV7264876.1 sugar porter family MFS transporter [Rhodococcus oxybenzonivorans]MDV7278233.1 sugar porter family MFS transporter [Rhodococcus oxybenzonivorans]MDV7332279.1 sugar porter family MFS transporter [Rhodococcus oxybenzonivorans]MDV7347890.1 sugar porter family MFS transporter [Rhodococcus oxybenzonivorans]
MTQISERHTAKVIGVTVAAAVGGFLFGFDSSVINGAVDSIQGHFELSSFFTGFAVAIALLGCAVGAWFAGRLADRWGRKKVMLLGSVLFVVSSIGSGLAFSVPDLMLWRILGGLGIGIASVIAPTYIAEIAPARYRGGLASLQQLAITLGIFAALLSDAVLQNAAGGASNELWLNLEAWRWMFLVGVAPALVYGLLALLIPESPRYLVGKHLDQEAADVLANITGELDPHERVSEIRLTLRHESTASFDDIRGPKFGLQPIVWVGIFMAIFQQFVGINAIFYYSTTLWKSVGFTENESFTTSVITAVINVGMTFVAILFVDRIGRRILLMVGSLGMFVSLLTAAIAFSQATGSGDDVVLPSPWGAVALIGANLFVIFFAATWGPVMWVMLGEMFPNNMRAYALGISTAANWIANFTVTLSFPPLTRSVGLWFLYGLFAFFALLSFFFVRSKVRETKGMELEEMTT